MKPWLNVSEAAEYASVSRDTIYTACERGELRTARVSGRRAIRIRPAWIDAWLEQTRAGRSRSPTHRRHAERSDVMNARATTTERDQARRAHSPNARSPSCWGCQSLRCVRGGIEGRGRVSCGSGGRFGTCRPTWRTSFGRAQLTRRRFPRLMVNRRLGELPRMSLWKRGRQYWTDFTVAGRRYRKRLGTTNLRTATRRERELVEEAGHGRLSRRRTRAEAALGCDRRLPGLPSGCGARRGRSSSRRNGSASSRSTSATCRSRRSPRRRLRSSSARGTRPASRTARSTWTSACCRACSSPAAVGGRSRTTCRICRSASVRSAAH